MHFLARDVLSVYTDDLAKERPEAMRNAAERLMPEQSHDRERVIHLVNFLLSLPPKEDQEKILNTLTEIAAKKHVAISDFRWWDFMGGEYWLFADIIRDGEPILICFVWKTVEKGKSSRTIPQHVPSWMHDASAPGGWRFEFDFAEYHDMVGGFQNWLNEPLPKRPGR